MVLKQYDEIIQDQLERGIIEEVKGDGVICNVTYLPHREVIKNQGSTTKYRIVYDASAKSRNQVSLKIFFIQVRVWIQNFTGLLLQFRLYPIAI